MGFDKSDLKIVAALVGIFIVGRFIVKKTTKKPEQKSGFLGSPFGKRVMFTLTNSTKDAQVVPLFNSFSNIQNPNVGISPSISEFNRSLSGEPKILKLIEISSPNNKTQVQKPIQVYCKDASGEIKSSNLYPMVSSYQVATDMTSVQPQNLVLDGGCYINYTVDPGQTVVLTFHYDLEKTPVQELKSRAAPPIGIAAGELNTNNTTQKALSPSVASPQPQPAGNNKFGMGKTLLIGAGIIGGTVLVGKLIESKVG